MKSGRVGVATQHLHGADSCRRLAAAGRHRRARSLLDNKAPRRGRARTPPKGESLSAGRASHQEPTGALNLQRDSLVVVLRACRELLEARREVERGRNEMQFDRCQAANLSHGGGRLGARGLDRAPQMRRRRSRGELRPPKLRGAGSARGALQKPTGSRHRCCAEGARPRRQSRRARRARGAPQPSRRGARLRRQASGRPQARSGLRTPGRGGGRPPRRSGARAAVRAAPGRRPSRRRPRRPRRGRGWWLCPG